MLRALTTQADVQPIFETRGLKKAFGDHVLLDGADLRVLPSETLSIVGESGSGKSVFLKLLVGLDEPDAGDVLFKGKNVSEMAVESLAALRQDVGFVFQADALFDSMTVLENIGYGMREHTKATADEIRARAVECLQKVGLEEDRLELYPSELSGGQRKRVGIARAVAIRPKIILYDEPTQGLDPQSITRIGVLIEELQNDLDATSVVVTHDMRTAFTVSDRIALLHEHRFEHIGTPAEFAQSEIEPIRAFLADALDELRDLPFLQVQNTNDVRPV